MASSKQKQKMRKKKSLKSKIFLLVFVFIIVGFAGYGALTSNLNKMVNGIDKDREIVAEKVDSGDAVNILVLGADFVEGENTAMDKRRTDAIMIVNYNPKTKKVVAVSVPRDTRVKSYGKDAKINSINKEGGPKKVLETLNDLLDIKINYYFLLDYTGFNKIIDAIGGVPITIPYNMKYDDDLQDLHIDFKKDDELTLDGKKAEEFFRWRHNNEGEEIAQTIDFGGDLGRIENQRYFLNALIKKVSTTATITKIPKVLSIATEYVNTNMIDESTDSVDLGLMLGYVKAIAKLGTSNIEFVTLRGEVPEENNPNWYFNYKSGKNQDIKAALNGNLFFNRENKKVSIVNGTTVNGLATKLRNDTIKKDGYDETNIKTETSPQGIEESVIEVYDIDKAYDDIIKEDFASTEITKILHKEGSNEYDSNIVIKIGTDRNKQN